MNDPACRPVRSFVAIALAGAARAALEDLLAMLRPLGPGVAWIKSESLHVTLKFLGGVHPERLDGLAQRLASVAATQLPFVIDVRGCGGFPTLLRPHALWVGIHASQLAPLAAAVDEACAREGCERETRAFRPHVTLGRVRRSALGRAARRRSGNAGGGQCPKRGAVPDMAVYRDTAFGPSPAEAMVLLRSDLGPGGARHTPIGRWPFTGDDVDR